MSQGTSLPPRHRVNACQPKGQFLYLASRDSAKRAVIRGQPFNMLKPEHYEQWKDIEITFDPRDMIRG